jgi:hypothetical protein
MPRPTWPRCCAAWSLRKSRSAPTVSWPSAPRCAKAIVRWALTWATARRHIVPSLSATSKRPLPCGRRSLRRHLCQPVVPPAVPPAISTAHQLYGHPHRRTARPRAGDMGTIGKQVGVILTGRGCSSVASAPPRGRLSFRAPCPPNMRQKTGRRPVARERDPPCVRHPVRRVSADPRCRRHVAAHRARRPGRHLCHL